MNEPRDVEWEDWGRAWRQGAGPASMAHLRQRADRRRRAMAVIFAAEILFGLLILVVSAFLALRRSAPGLTLWAVLVWICVGLAVGFATWNRHQAWRPEGESTHAFLRLERLRCHRQVRLLWFVPLFFLLQVGLGALLFEEYHPSGLWFASMLWAALGLITGGWWVWWRRRTLRQLKAVEALLAELEDEA